MDGADPYGSEADCASMSENGFAKMTFLQKDGSLVRRDHSPDGGWHPVNDNLVGDTTPAYGDFSNDPLAQSTFGVKFGTDYTECMFKLSVGRLDSVV